MSRAVEMMLSNTSLMLLLVLTLSAQIIAVGLYIGLSFASRFLRLERITPKAEVSLATAAASWGRAVFEKPAHDTVAYIKLRNVATRLSQLGSSERKRRRTDSE